MTDPALKNSRDLKSAWFQTWSKPAVTPSAATNGKLLAHPHSPTPKARPNSLRFLMMLPVLALAGNLAQKKSIPPSPGTFPVNTPLFTVLLVSVVLILGALTFFPALSLGPILEHLLLKAGQLF